MPRDKEFVVRLDEPDKKNLEVLAKRHKLTQKEVAGYLFDLAKKYDLFEGDWKGRLDAGDESLSLNSFAYLDPDHGDYCIARAWDEENWKCVWGKFGSPFKSKKLGINDKGMLGLCAACKRTTNLEDRWKQIVAKDKNGWTAEHTYCSIGSEYNKKTGKVHCRMPVGVDMNYHWEDQDFCSSLIDPRSDVKGCSKLRTLPARRIEKTGIRRR